MIGPIVNSPSFAGLAGRFAEPERRETSLFSLTTLVVAWGMVAVGVTGAWLGYPISASPEVVSPTRIEFVQVELTDAPTTPSAANRATAQPAPSLPASTVPKIPPPPQVMAPGAQVAFAMPIEAMPLVLPEAAVMPVSTTADAALAERGPIAGSPSLPAGGFDSGTAAAESLIWGRGEGRQPAPEYPRRAVREGQEGAVLVRFTVDESGQVLMAEAARPSPWPLLNEAAVRAVRERWRFSAGKLRRYDVVIRFQLED